MPSELGPYPADGAPAATASLTMTAVARAFDPAVSSPPGDFWDGSMQFLSGSQLIALPYSYRIG